MSLRRHMVTAAIVAALAGSAVVGASPADASATKANCGAGYKYRDTIAINYLPGKPNRLTGYVSWYVNTKKKKLCAVTRPLNTKKKHKMMVAITRERKGKMIQPAKKEGTSRYYVGPVWASISEVYGVYGSVDGYLGHTIRKKW